MRKHSIYVVLTRTNTIVSRIIHIFTNDRYTHASISLDRELKYMYSFGRKWAYNPFIGGFKYENLYEGGYKFSKILPGIIIELKITEEQYNNVNSLLNQFISNPEDYKYNYLGLVNNLMNKEVCYEYRFLCSEFVYHVLKESGIVDFNKARNLVKPVDFLNLKGEVVFEGDLRTLDLGEAAKKSPFLYYNFFRAIK
mgnify:CR=1 FL=1